MNSWNTSWHTLGPVIIIIIIKIIKRYHNIMVVPSKHAKKKKTKEWKSISFKKINSIKIWFNNKCNITTPKYHYILKEERIEK